MTCPSLAYVNWLEIEGATTRIDLVLFVVLALLDKINGIKNERLVHDSAERALIYARAAGDALVVVDAMQPCPRSYV